MFFLVLHFSLLIYQDFVQFNSEICDMRHHRFRRGEGGINLLFGKVLAENCIKMKEIGGRGGASLASPLDPPMHKLVTKLVFLTFLKDIICSQ